MTRKTLPLLLLSLAQIHCDGSTDGCTQDTDCYRPRVCTSGQCIYPTSPNKGDSQGDAQPGDPYPGDAQQGDPYPGDTQRGDPYPGDTQQGDPYPGDMQQGDPYPGDARQGDPYPGDARQGDIHAGDAPGDIGGNGDAGIDWGPENTVARCSDGYDNDHNNYIDCGDFGCAFVPPCDVLHEAGNIECADGSDNDNDTYIDCDEFTCFGYADCHHYPEYTEFDCRDGVDNDADDKPDCLDPGCRERIFCQMESVRLMTFNIGTVGAVTEPAYAHTLSIFERLDADIACLQEFHEDDAPVLNTLALESEYPDWFLTDLAPLGGPLANLCFSRIPLEATYSWSASDISGDYATEDIGRDILELNVTIVPGDWQLAVFVVHFKAGTTDADRFRRQIEAIRTVQVVQAHRGVFPNGKVVVMGDLNEEIDSPNLGQVFTELPAGLPWLFQLGADISFPVVYNPFVTIQQAGLEVVDATHEDSTTIHETHFPTHWRLDYIFTDGYSFNDEVYDECRDNGVDDLPTGNFLPKAGIPLDCATVGQASDHRPVVVDLAKQ